MTGRPGPPATTPEDVPSHATLVSPVAAAALTWRPLEPYDGVDDNLLWRSGKSVAGLMRIGAGAIVSRHAHIGSHHHMWVADGEVEMLGEVVAAGGYAHIPAHVDHELRCVGEHPATVLSLYLREDGDPAS
jgi:hypothetical protein